MTEPVSATQRSGERRGNRLGLQAQGSEHGHDGPIWPNRTVCELGGNGSAVEAGLNRMDAEESPRPPDWDRCGRCAKVRV